MRPIVKEDYKLTNPAEASVILGRMWKELSDDEKQKKRNDDSCMEKYPDHKMTVKVSK